MKLLIFVAYCLVTLNFTCGNAQIKKANDTPDKPRRPAHFSPNAQLLNLGSKEEPILVWADYAGPLQRGMKTFPHILGIHYYYVLADSENTIYYENFDLRKGAKQVDLKSYSIINYPGDATVKISNGKDSMLLFSVMQSEEYSRVHRGINFKKLPTISKRDNIYESDVDIEFNLTEIGSGIFEVALNDGTKIKYGLSKDCKDDDHTASFLNREDGRIYLIDQSCYLQLVDNEDLKKFQAPR